MRYKILYVGYVNDNIMTSVEMFSFGIIRALKKLDVELKVFNLYHYNTTTPNGVNMLLDDLIAVQYTDFVLCHMYHSNLCSKIYYALKKITKYDVSVFMEMPICGGIYDQYFLYFDDLSYDGLKNKYKVYNAPILKDFYPKTEKIKNTILLDHGWEEYKGTTKEIMADIVDWLKELSNDYKIYRLVRYDENLSDLPDYIIPLNHMKFNDYINAILDKEIFISTHYGSYNSTAIDMIASGAKCLIPKINGLTFIPQYNVDYFNLSTFSNKEELINEIKTPLDYKIFDNQINKCTDIDDIIFDIDKLFRLKINNNFKKIKNTMEKLISDINEILDSNCEITFNNTIREINKNRDLGSSNQCYWVMYKIVKFFDVATVLEIGTHKGASAITFCQAILDNNWYPRIYSVDNWSQAENENIARENIFTSGFENYIKMIKGDSLTIIPELLNELGGVGLVFIDGNHADDYVMKDYNNCKDYTNLILFHDTSKGEYDYLKQAEKDGFKVYNFETKYVEGDGHLVGIALAVKQ